MKQPSVDEALSDLSRAEWESLCDGCARCCLHKLEDEDTGELFYTAIACQFLDTEACRCMRYEDRETAQPGCVALTPENLVTQLSWLPPTCAYLRVATGEDLPLWHHLISGDRNAVHRVGISVRGRVVMEQDVDAEKMETTSWTGRSPAPKRPTAARINGYR
jgi:uncharacterized cysteine cluster protein YcgN (CxxCxxCC family)